MTDPGTTRPDESILAPDPASAGARTQPGPNCDARRSWVPIRSLAPRHRARIAAHLCALDANDRHLRFGYPANDTQISRYVDMLDFEHDEVFGVFNRRLDLIALAHLAHPTIAPADEPAGTSEFGVSVLPRARGERPFGRQGGGSAPPPPLEPDRDDGEHQHEERDERDSPGQFEHGRRRYRGTGRGRRMFGCRMRDECDEW